MSPIADRAREADRAAAAATTPEERIALALRLGERDARVYAEAHGVSMEEARRVLRENRRRGRTPSRCA
ncbi:MAG: hypothetical protein ACOZNI_33070 [Myxococcota bacterium]